MMLPNPKITEERKKKRIVILKNIYIVQNIAFIESISIF